MAPTGGQAKQRIFRMRIYLGKTAFGPEEGTGAAKILDVLGQECSADHFVLQFFVRGEDPTKD